jgi:hypothetical protein
MYARFKVLGLALIIAGAVFVAVGGYTYIKTQEGTNALHAFSAAQNVELAYNDQGELVDRGETAGSAAIMGLLTSDWGFTVNPADFDPNDPVVNTASEYMYQMATVAYHTLTGTQTVVLTEPVDYDGETYAAGSYEVAVNGRYWSQFDRQNPLDGPAREQAWTGTAHGLIASLGVGSVTASALQMGYGIAAIAAALGALLVLIGIGVIWAARPLVAPARSTARAVAPAGAAA